MSQQRWNGLPRCGAAEAWGGAVERDDARQVPVACPDRRGDRVQLALAFLERLGVASLSDALELASEAIRIGDRPLGVRAERWTGTATGEGEHHLACRGRVRDRGPADARVALDVLLRADEVDRHRIRVARNGERCRLVELGDERFEVR